MARSVEELAAFAVQAADGMRRWPTPAERRVRPILEAMGFRFQHPMLLDGKGGRIRAVVLDFYHEDLRLCVEVDGGYHRRRRGPDGRRDRRLLAVGVRTVRLTNAEAMGPAARVRAKIQAAMEGGR